MKDIVRFAVDKSNPWVKNLGFDEFLYHKNLNIVVGGDEATNTNALSRKNTNILVYAETSEARDHLNWRNSGLNQMLLKLAQKNDIAIGFCLSSVLEHQGIKRSAILGRMMQNVVLCRKYKVRMVLCSFAKDIWGLRSASDLQSFGRVIGMTPSEVKQALNLHRTQKGIHIDSS